MKLQRTIYVVNLVLSVSMLFFVGCMGKDMGPTEAQVQDSSIKNFRAYVASVQAILGIALPNSVLTYLNKFGTLPNLGLASELSAPIVTTAETMDIDACTAGIQASPQSPLFAGISLSNSLGQSEIDSMVQTLYSRIVPDYQPSAEESGIVAQLAIDVGSQSSSAASSRHVDAEAAACAALFSTYVFNNAPWPSAGN